LEELLCIGAFDFVVVQQKDQQGKEEQGRQCKQKHAQSRKLCAEVPDFLGHCHREGHDTCAERNFGHVPCDESIFGLRVAHRFHPHCCCAERVYRLPT